MLVISRKPGETLHLGDQIKVTVLSVSGEKVAIGIDAPRDISILRSELVETIESNKASSVQKIDESTFMGLANLLKEKDAKK